MIFYLAVDEYGHTKILGTQGDAAKVNKTFEQIDIPTDKAGLMAWVQQMLDETINDRADLKAEPGIASEAADFHPETDSSVVVEPVAQTESYTEKSMRIEAEHDALPLAFRFHLAAKTMEQARSMIPQFKISELGDE